MRRVIAWRVSALRGCAISRNFPFAPATAGMATNMPPSPWIILMSCTAKQSSITSDAVAFSLPRLFPESVTLMSVMLIIISAPFSRCGGKIIAYLNPYFKRFSISNISNSSFPLRPPYVRTARRGAAYNSVCRILRGKGYISSGWAARACALSPNMRCLPGRK